MPSGAENPNYHRSKLIKSYDIQGDIFGPYNDYFGSSYGVLFTNTIKNSTPYVIRQRDRLDVISFNNYGNTSLWWAIALFNPNIYHPLVLNVGETINIPSKKDIDSFFLSFKSGTVNAAGTTVQV